MEGSLKKLGVKGPRNGWKKRWFKQKGNKLYYYVNETENKEKGNIDLEKIISCIKTTNSSIAKKGSYVFQINTPQRIYHLQADNESNMNYWMNGINEYLQPSNNNNNSDSEIQQLTNELETFKNRINDLERQNEKYELALNLCGSVLKTSVNEILNVAENGGNLQLPTLHQEPQQPKVIQPQQPKVIQHQQPQVQAVQQQVQAVQPQVNVTKEDSSDDDNLGGQFDNTDDHFEAKVLYEYSARKNYELSISVGEEITVLSKHENGWWLGCNSEGVQGYFPGSYVRPANS
eukprot:TRINITY_DN59_c1_g1_i1.p1 TRINITY_DN59_c1_g1~~TRINITY_DN59_c1_g1_i1.p1  ORF type:complete len:289 (+),score=109.85 TRINITY_DN59_c1_g1_i1:85-951(+)